MSQFFLLLRNLPVLAVILIFTVRNAQSEELPRIVIPEAEWNFGEISQGERVRHTFAIENKGNAPLHISKVVAACGCTAALMESDTVAPGEEGKLQVEFDSTGFSGEKFKSIRLFTNDPKESIAMVSLQGFIEPDIFIEPKRVLFGEVIQGSADSSSRSRDVVIRVRDGKNAQIGTLQATGSGIQVEELSRNQRELKFRVSLDADAPPGELRRRIVVGLRGAERRAVNIPVFATVQGALRVQPPTLGFGVLEGQQPISRKVRVESLTDDKISIVSIRSQHPAVTVRQISEAQSKVYTIEVTVDPKKVQRDLRASITVKTNHPQQQEVVLSVYGILPPSL
jgi:hypothetical protein